MYTGSITGILQHQQQQTQRSSLLFPHLFSSLQSQYGTRHRQSWRERGDMIISQQSRQQRTSLRASTFSPSASLPYHWYHIVLWNTACPRTLSAISLASISLIPMPCRNGKSSPRFSKRWAVVMLLSHSSCAHCCCRTRGMLILVT